VRELLSVAPLAASGGPWHHSLSIDESDVGLIQVIRAQARLVAADPSDPSQGSASLRRSSGTTKGALPADDTAFALLAGWQSMGEHIKALAVRSVSPVLLHLE